MIETEAATWYMQVTLVGRRQDLDRLTGAEQEGLTNVVRAMVKEWDLLLIGELHGSAFRKEMTERMNLALGRTVVMDVVFSGAKREDAP